MKAIVCDAAVLSSLQPSFVEAYLQGTGWHECHRIPDRVSIWSRDTFSEDKSKIQLPLDPEFDDFPLRMSEVLEKLEITENRSQLDILSELISQLKNVEIQGVVTQVKQLGEEASGLVTMIGIVVNKLRKIHAYLSEADYIIAIEAYQKRSPIQITGDLIEDGNDFVLKNPRDFGLNDG